MPRSMRLSFLLCVFALAGAPDAATALQLTPATGWRTVTDRPARLVVTPDKPEESTFTFVPMPPGWHITMGPGGVHFDPRNLGLGDYTIESQIFHFPNSSNGEYGIIVGGRDLEGAAARYVVFAARGDGSVAAWERSGGQNRMLAEWRRADAVHAADGKEIVANLFRLIVTAKEAVLRANGLDALIVPLGGLNLDGQLGFRVGPGVNLHVSALTVTSRLAPGQGS
jgi:hypothetical protein